MARGQDALAAAPALQMVNQSTRKVMAMVMVMIAIAIVISIMMMKMPEMMMMNLKRTMHIT